MSFIIKTIINVATDWKSVCVHWLLLRYKIAPIFSRSWLQQIIGPCTLPSVREKSDPRFDFFSGAPYDRTWSVCAGHYIAYIGLTHRVYIHQCPFRIVKDWIYTVMIYSIILMQYIKGWAIHLSCVDRRTDVFCLFNMWNFMRPIVARLNPVVNKA